MRIISGTARGRKLKAPAGMETRPTTDLVKESIFNIIQFDLEGRRVLDLFAGTGQMGIEALSRGAAECTFVDLRREPVRLIRENLEILELSAHAQVLQLDALNFVKTCQKTFDLIFLDPPYEGKLLEKTLELIKQFDILSESGIMVREGSVGNALPPLSPPYAQGRNYRYGKIQIALYHKTPRQAVSSEEGSL